MGKLLELEAVSKDYGAESVLTEISLTVETGRTLAIIGDSGGGKTTLLSIMGLLQHPSRGRVIIDGRDTGGLQPREQARLRGQYCGFVFQRARLLNSLSALENVLAPAWFTKPAANLEQRAKNLLARFDLSHRLDYKPQALSLGQLRRVSLARALLLEPPLLLADEPTNDLNPELAEDVAACLLQARDNGAAVVIVTHDPVLAARADSVLRLRQGQLYPEPAGGDA